MATHVTDPPHRFWCIEGESWQAKSLCRSGTPCVSQSSIHVLMPQRHGSSLSKCQCEGHRLFLGGAGFWCNYTCTRANEWGSVTWEGRSTCEVIRYGRVGSFLNGFEWIWMDSSMVFLGRPSELPGSVWLALASTIRIRNMPVSLFEGFRDGGT